jgi:hypothetical protein
LAGAAQPLELAVKIEYHPSNMTADSLPAWLIARRDAGTQRAARRAQAAILTLANTITPTDLVLQAFQQPNPAAWLDELAAHAEATRQALIADRRRNTATINQDGARRTGLDRAAIELMGFAVTEARGKSAEVAILQADEAQARTNMLGAGMRDEEIESILAARRAAGNPAHAAAVAAEGGTVRAAKLRAYLADPLRSTEHLGDELLAEVHARALQLAERGTVTSTGTGAAAVAA